MTSNYCFKFESNGMNIIVDFFEAEKSIDAAEALAQIGHAFRRNWALNLINNSSTNKHVLKVANWASSIFGN